jgi:hypothetical protein
MKILDITDRIFTVDERKELKTILRTMAKRIRLNNRVDLESRASFLLKKAGGSEKFFKDTSMKLCEILK